MEHGSDGENVVDTQVTLVEKPNILSNVDYSLTGTETGPRAGSWQRVCCRTGSSISRRGIADDRWKQLDYNGFSITYHQFKENP